VFRDFWYCTLELLANAVLGLAAGAVELLVETTRIVGSALRLWEVTMKRGLAPSSVYRIWSRPM
jgi:hypothetical protein